MTPSSNENATRTDPDPEVSEGQGSEELDEASLRDAGGGGDDPAADSGNQSSDSEADAAEEVVAGTDDSDQESGDGTDDGQKGKHKSRRSGSRKKNGGLTPGQRLAAAKAAKAKRKSQARGRQAEVVEEKVLERASKAGDWFDRNRRWVIGGALTLAVALCGYLLFAESQRSEKRAAGARVAEALDVEFPGIGAREQREEEPSSEELAKRGQEAFAAVLKGSSLGELAPWVRVAFGVRALRSGELETAKTAFEAALKSGSLDLDLLLRAREGLLFVAERNGDEAAYNVQLEALEATGDPTLEDIAAYHRARWLDAGADASSEEARQEQARRLLRELVSRRDGDREDAPDLPFTENQARVRLTELDPTYTDPSLPNFGPPGGAPGLSGPGGQSLPPEILELLQKQAGGGPTP